MPTTSFVNVLDPRPPKPVEFLKDYSRAFAGSMASAGFALGYRQALMDVQKRWAIVFRINRLTQKTLAKPLDAVVERDDHGYVAKTPDLPLYGYGEDRAEAIAMLQREIESLYEDLTEGGDFGDEWADVKRFLEEIVITE